MNTTTRVALVTGASSGIGESAARHLHAAGLTVYAAARRVDRMRDLGVSGIHPVALDVTDDASIVAVVDQILREQGRIDVLVNNAGYGSYGALEEVPMQEARAQIEVNLFGLARLIQLVVPAMRAQKSGTVINIASMGGQFATPLGSWYHASKFAVEGLSDALRLELDRFGINVVIIEPGSIRTEWGAIAADNLRATSANGPYATQAAGIATILESSSRPDARTASSPDVIGKAVRDAATARRPKTRYRMGFGAKPLVFLSEVLPARAFDRLITRVFSVL